MTTLDELRGRLRGIAAQAARHDFDEALRQASEYGWARLLAGLNSQQRADLFRRLATAVNEQRQVIEKGAMTYDSVVSAIVHAADLEIERLECELLTCRAATTSAQLRPRGPSWLAVALAGVGGYWWGRKR